MVANGPNELQQCILLVASYAQKKIHALNHHFLDLPVFNKAKIFSSRNYPTDDSDRNTNTESRLKRTLLKFQFTEEESDMWKKELLELW